MRLPLWVLNREVHDVIRLHEARLRGEWSAEVQERPGFCAWVASNAARFNASHRLNFVTRLSREYRPVACGGECCNNVGGPVQDKHAFLRRHRFSIAYENASYGGYCTEKLLHAFAAGGVPIYWGDPHAAKNSSMLPDFNAAAMISAHDFVDEAALIAHIAAVDRDPVLLGAYLRQPILSTAWYERLRDWPAFCAGLAKRIASRLP
eukprot:NODE_15284_length_1058_cov_6.875403.p1 GENE.NODE_15284_length_1058_cov_6.875403~~NODE_15284_length_1058_cov_6.875403.p1  ORF type:complete len:206 (+),score=55.87 NODE_15284_length_1058_cov_6.875403:439-1056(+)